jgi:hypothetical protein
MKLDAARLCLDCEEIHESQICPVCSSEAFAYLTRWVQPAVERDGAEGRAERTHDPSPRAGYPRTPEQVEAYRQLIEGKPRRRAGLVTGSVLGLAAVSLAGWAIRASARRKAAQLPVPLDGGSAPREE